MRRSTLLVFLLLGLATPGFSQRQPNAPTPGSVATTDVRVQVVYTNDHPVDVQVRVELVATISDLQVLQAFTDGNGQCLLPRVPPGTYRIRVSGMGVQETVGQSFTITRAQGAAFQYIRVEPDKDKTDQPTSTEAMISAVDLNVPSKAKKEYAKGGQAAKKRDWEEAQTRFEKAISLYPQYVAAHNDLGVVFMNTGQRDKGRQMFEQAIALNDNYPRAHRNLGILLFQERKYGEAGTNLEKALAGDPLDAQALTVLAQVQLLLQKPLEAVATAIRVHALPHQQFVACHLIAARAYELLNKETDAMAEYTIFLKESPQNPNAPKVRAALDALKARTH